MRSVVRKWAIQTRQRSAEFLARKTRHAFRAMNLEAVEERTLIKRVLFAPIYCPESGRMRVSARLFSRDPAVVGEGADDHARLSAQLQSVVEKVLCLRPKERREKLEQAFV